MRLLIDTQILLWATNQPSRLPRAAAELIADPQTLPMFSVASIWEVAIKWASDRGDFDVPPQLLRRELLANQYEELAISGDHAAAVAGLPPLHKDPFDRLLAAQAEVEGIILLTADRVLARYPGPIRLV